MSQENVENLRATLERLDLEAWRRAEGDFSLLDPAVIYEDANLPDHVGETYRGHDGVARATERWLEPFEELTIELEEILGTGDRLVSVHQVRAKALHTGIEFTGPVAYQWTFRDGKVVYFRSYRDREEALEGRPSPSNWAMRMAALWSWLATGTRRRMRLDSGYFRRSHSNRPRSRHA